MGKSKSTESKSTEKHKEQGIKPAERIQIGPLEIEWHIPDDVKTQFVNHMVIQHDASEYFVSFFELRPPMVIGDAESVEKVKAMKSVRAECVARIVIPKERMGGFVQALNSVYAAKPPEDQSKVAS